MTRAPRLAAHSKPFRGWSDRAPRPLGPQPTARQAQPGCPPPSLLSPCKGSRPHLPRGPEAPRRSPAASPQHLSWPHGLLSVRTRQTLKTCWGTFWHLSRGGERALHWPPQASAPGLQGGGSLPSCQLVGGLTQVKGQKEQYQQAETAAGPRAWPSLPGTLQTQPVK